MADADTMLTVDRSNYTICRVVARRSPPPITARPEVCYQPLLLRELAACALIQTRRPLPPTLPADLEVLLDAARKRAANRMESCRWDFKERACPDITYLRIGNFEDYPGFMNRYLPGAFSCPLAEQAPRILAMLASADACQELTTTSFIATTIRVRYPLFLRLQSAHPNETLVPPIDVQAVWFTHMLQSDEYLPWMLKHWPEVANLPHVATRAWCPAELAKAEQRTMALWAEHKQPWRTEPGPEPPGKEDADVPAVTTVLNDRQWYRQYHNATRNNTHVSQPEFYTRAALGYQRYMFLVAKLPNRMEAYGFAPSPPIDLMWHTHLAQPLAFRADWTRLLGHVHHHKLLKPAERRRIMYHNSADFEVKLWRTEFNESFQLYASELTESPTPYDEQRHYAKAPEPLPPTRGFDDFM